MSIDTDLTTALIRQLVSLGDAWILPLEQDDHFLTKWSPCYSGALFSAKPGVIGMRELDNGMGEIRSFVSKIPGASLRWGADHGPKPGSEMSVDFSIAYNPPLPVQEEAPPLLKKQARKILARSRPSRPRNSIRSSTLKCHESVIRSETRSSSTE